MALGVAAVIICVVGNVSVVGLQIELKSNQDWLDRLTNRKFYERFWEALKSDDRSYLDIDQLFDEAGKEAVADIKKASDQSRAEFGFFDKPTWHFFGAILHSVSLLIGSLVYFGTAIWVGASWGRPF